MLDLYSFFSGAIFGVFFAYIFLAYLLLQRDSEGSSDVNKEDADFSLGLGSECSRKENGLDNVDTKKKYHENDPTATELQILDDAMLALNGELTKVLPKENDSKSTTLDTLATKEMVQKFTTYSAEAKERQKHIKAFCFFLDELGKAHGVFSKYLLKVSKLAESHVVGKNAFLDKWWNSFAIALDHMSQDQAYANSALCIGLREGMMSVETEHELLEKNIYTEGKKLLNKLREVNDAFTAKKKEFERVRDKTGVKIVKSPPPNRDSSAGLTSTSQSSPSSPSSTIPPVTPNKIKNPKYDAALRDAHEATARLTSCQQDFDEKMPRMLRDYELMASNGQSSMMALLIKVTNLLTEIQRKNNQITDRLKMDLAASAAKDGGKCQQNYNPVIQELLEDIARHGASRAHMNMSLESTAGLASSLFTNLPPLPPQIKNSIGSETCVWFNAFNGRIYRDAARSAYFNEWFCVKVTNLLNKGKKSAMIDEYQVSDVNFGSLPPLIRNMQWIPITEESYDCEASTRERDCEYDVDCTADIAFRSGLSFTVSTRLWINWPVEKYAFIPMVLKLECTEVCGKVRFGVMRDRSFFSFVGEPYTRFNVKSEVGDQYKLKNLPKISTLVINKIKKHIRTKLVYPNHYKFRLMWPKRWWPVQPEVSRENSKQEINDEASNSIPRSHDNISQYTSYEGIDMANSGSKSPSGDFSPSNKSMWSAWFASSSRKLKKLREKEVHFDDAMSEDSSISDSDSDVDEKPIDELDANGNAPKSVQQPDRVRLYVSALLRRASIKAPPVTMDGYAQDDILIQKKHSTSGSIAIVRARSHSISEFRHAALEVMWGEFLGSIGHDFATLSSRETESRNKDDPLQCKGPPCPRSGSYSTPKNTAIRHRRRRILSAMKDRLLGNLRHQENVRRREENFVSAPSHPTDNRHATPISSCTTPNSLEVESLSDETVNFTNETTSSHLRLSSPGIISNLNSSAPFASQQEGSGISPKEMLRPTATSIPDTKFHMVSPNVSPPIDNCQTDVEQTLLNSNGSLNSNNEGDMHDASRRENSSFSPVQRHNLRNPLASITKPTLQEAEGDVKNFSSHIKSEDITESKPKSKSGYRHRLSLVVGSLRKAAISESVPQKRALGADEYEAETQAMQQEAMKLTWQAHAEVITVSAMNGEHPCLQNFMRAPQQAAGRCWVVLKKGKLLVYPNNTKRGRDVALDTLQPLKEICLYGCSCRPMEQKNGFEVGLVNLTTDRNLNQIELSQLEVQRWVPFYTEMEEQCRVWIMAIQFSATMHRYVEK